jgi:hypothetical protein
MDSRHQEKFPFLEEDNRELAEAGHQEKVPVPGRGERTTGRGWTSGENLCSR